MNQFTMADLNGYAISMGFTSERERVEMFLSVPQWHEDRLWTWLDKDGTKAGLEKILNTKRRVRRITEEEPHDPAEDTLLGGSENVVTPTEEEGQ